MLRTGTFTHVVGWSNSVEAGVRLPDCCWEGVRGNGFSQPRWLARDNKLNIVHYLFDFG